MKTTVLRGVVDDGTREIPLVNKFGKLICNVGIIISGRSLSKADQKPPLAFHQLTANEAQYAGYYNSSQPFSFVVIALSQLTTKY